MNSLFVSRIHYKLTICSPFCYEFKIYFANLLWIHHRYRKLTINSLSISPIHFPFTLSREFNMNTLSLRRIHYEFIFHFVNLLSTSRENNQFTVCIANSRWIHFIFRQFTVKLVFFRGFIINSLSVSRLHHLFHDQFTICIANSLCHQFIFRQFTFNSRI